jgi:outer membrane lipoprotein-sorting protein
METESNEVTRALDDLGGALRGQPSVRNEVMRRVTQHAATGGSTTGSTAQWRGRRLLGKLAAVAACAVVALLIWNPWGNTIGASEAFAAAIAKVEAAGTFACRQVSTQIVDGQKVPHEMAFMFKEPNLERLEYGEGMPSPGEFMVTDYDKQIRLVARPEDKTASLQDISTMYTTDERTGELKLTQLGTRTRDDVLRISAQAIKDLGKVQLNGREVWALQSADGVQPVKTVYVNPADGKPVQVELNWESGESFVYTDIQIDADLDDKLFSLEPPAGYAMHGGHTEPVKGVDDMNGKMMGKMMSIMREFLTYMSKHDGKWPTTLDDLRAAGMDARKLQTLLAAPDSRDGKPVILYRQPKPDERDVIVLYEAPEFRRKQGVVVGFSDCHAELLPYKQFDEAMQKLGAAK